MKNAQGLLNSFPLLCAQRDCLVYVGLFGWQEMRAPFLKSLYRILHGLKVDCEPLRLIASVIEGLAEETGSLHNSLYIIIAEWLGHLRSIVEYDMPYSKLCVQKLIANHRGMSVLFNSLVSCGVERLAVGRKLRFAGRRRKRRLSDFEKPLVIFVWYGHNVYELVLEGVSICHLTCPLSAEKYKSASFSLASP